MSAATHSESSPNTSHLLSDIPKPSGSNAEPQDIWTTARCEQILQDLHAKIDAVGEDRSQKGSKILAKEVNKNVSARKCADYKYRSHPWAERRACEPRVLQSNVERLGGPELDAEWHDIPRPAKRARNTYTAKLRNSRRSKKWRGMEIPDFSKIELEMPLSFHKTQSIKLGQKRDRIVGGEALLRHRKHCPRHTCLHTFSKYGVLCGAKDRPESKQILGYLSCEPASVSLFNFISALLDKNMARTEVSIVGVSSLFSTCLRKVAEDIAAEEHQSEGNDSKNQVYNISHVYKDLEDYFSSGPSSSGWLPLRELVRYHAMHILSRRSSCNQLFSLFNFLICECAEDEAKVLYDGWLDGGRELSELEHSYFRFPYWDSIEDFTTVTGKCGYAYQRIAQILDEHRLPFTSLKRRELAACLNGAIAIITNANEKSVLEDHDEESAALLLCTVVRQSYLMWAFTMPHEIHNLRLGPSRREEQQESTKACWWLKKRPHTMIYLESEREASGNCLKNSSFNALAILLATEISRQRESINCGSRLCYTKVFMCLQQMGLETRQYLKLREFEGPGGVRQYERLIIPLLAAGLATVMANKSTSKRSSISADLSAIVELNPGQSALKRAGSFLSKVALHYARATGAENEFAIMQNIFDHLDNTREASGPDTKARKMMDKIKIAAAFGLCHDSSRPNRQEWAMKISQAANLDKVAITTGTPPRKIARYDGGYRWEEGISEWVERTPLPLVLKRKDWSDSDCEDCPDGNSPTKQTTRTMIMSESTTHLQRSPTPERSSTGELMVVSALENNQPSASCSQAPSSRQAAPNASHTTPSDDKDDVDELSAPDESIHIGRNEIENPVNRLRRIRRQGAGMGTAGQDSGRIGVGGEDTPSWVRKRTYLSFKREAQEVEDAEDELGSG